MKYKIPKVKVEEVNRKVHKDFTLHTDFLRSKGRRRRSWFLSLIIFDKEDDAHFIEWSDTQSKKRV